MNGWVKFHRQIEEWRWYHDANTFRMFFHLVMKANHTPKEWMGIIVDRGQKVTSYPVLASELGISVSQAKTALSHLRMTGEVAVKTTNKYSIVTIKNYDKYQAKDDDDDECADDEVAVNIAGKMTGKSQANRRQIATNKNDKNDKKDVYTTPLPPSPDIPYQEIQTAYNETCVRLPKVVAMTESRRKAIRARWNAYPDIETFKEVFVRTARSDFMNGGNDRNWLASFDWLMKEQNMAKVLEGKYENRKEVKIDDNVNRSGVGPDGRYREYHAPEEYDRMYIASLSEVQ